MQQFRWWLADVRDAIARSSDAKLVGGLALAAVVAGGGYIAAGEVSNAGAGTDSGTRAHLARLVTTVRQPVTVSVHGHTVVRWRKRRVVVQAQPRTVMERETVQTPSGTKVITRPVVHYRIAYRKVVRNGKTSTVVVPQTVAVQQTVTDSRTSTVSQTETDVQTVTQPVTVVQTETVVTTVTEPGTTVTLPGTTVTVPVP
jgi:hypothetical protein